MSVKTIQSEVSAEVLKDEGSVQLSATQMTDDDQPYSFGLTLTPTAARELADELIEAADAADAEVEARDA